VSPSLSPAPGLRVPSAGDRAEWRVLGTGSSSDRCWHRRSGTAPAAVRDPPLPALIRLRYTRGRRGCSPRALPQCRCHPPDRPPHRDPGKGAGGGPRGRPIGARRLGGPGREEPPAPGQTPPSRRGPGAELPCVGPLGWGLLCSSAPPSKTSKQLSCYWDGRRWLYSGAGDIPACGQLRGVGGRAGIWGSVAGLEGTGWQLVVAARAGTPGSPRRDGQRRGLRGGSARAAAGPSRGVLTPPDHLPGAGVTASHPAMVGVHPIPPPLNPAA